MMSLVRYAFQANIGVPYLLSFALVFLAPGPFYVRLGIYIFMAIPLLAIAAVLRRYERRRKIVRATVYETLRRAHAHVPSRVGTEERPSLIGICDERPFVHCHFLAATVGHEVHVLVVSRWWPYRLREVLRFDSVGGWRAWAREHRVRVLPEGKYSDAVYRRYFERSVDAWDAFSQPRVR